jgi:hypothetical protein
MNRIAFATIFSFIATVILVIAGVGLLKASLLAAGFWLFGEIVMAVWNWSKAEPPVSPWQRLDLGVHGSQARLQMIFDKYEVVGSCNIRDGQVFPVVHGGQLLKLASRLRGAVRLHKRHPNAGADLYFMEQNIVGLVDLTIMEVEAAASVIERVDEDRQHSRKLYRGFGQDEVMQMARVAAADFVRKEAAQDEDGDSLVIANSIKRGEHDNHPVVRTAVATVQFILKIKGNDL